MNNSKTIETINRYYSVIEKARKETISHDEEFLLIYPELDLAKNIIQEFGEDLAENLANVILSVVKQ